jgi:hypothetical protein
MKILIIIPVFLIAILTSAQTIINPSLEGTPQVGIPPSPWLGCKFNCSSDTQPGCWNVTTPPSDGNSYVSMVTRTDGTSEDVTTELDIPLYAGHCYKIKADLAISSTFYGGNSYYNPCILRIWGGLLMCELIEILAVSGPVENTNWMQYEFNISPQNGDYKFLSFEVYFTGANYYYGNILIDHILLDVIPDTLDIGNDTTLCIGDSVTLNAGSGYENYNWSNGSADSAITVSQTGNYWVGCLKTVAFLKIPCRSTSHQK